MFWEDKESYWRKFDINELISLYELMQEIKATQDKSCKKNTSTQKENLF